VRANLMHRKDFTRLRQSQTSPPLDSAQLVLAELRRFDLRFRDCRAPSD
jgi:hypothetical protein